MPELPEVETVARSLRPYVLGRAITQVTILKDKSFPDHELLPQVIGRPIADVRRRAKLIIIDLVNSYHLVTHLKMTGQLLFRRGEQLAGGGHPTNDFLAQLPGKHTRLIFDLDDGSQLFFNDQRIFGWVRVMDDKTLEGELAKYGPDAHQLTDPDQLYRQLSRRSLPIKQALLDNKVVAGIGNIYAAEICFACRLDPRTPAKNLTRTQVGELAQQAHDILTAAIQLGGTTFDGRYVDADGHRGNFEEKLQVYGRGGQGCLVCGTSLQTVRLGGRATVFCPRCQS